LRVDVEPGSADDALVERLMAQDARPRARWLPGLARALLRAFVLVCHAISVDE
jgi:hypothetical protein